MTFYELRFEDFRQHRPWRFVRVGNLHELNLRIAREAVDAIKQARADNRQTLIITPTGPLDYTYWARLCNHENVSCEPLVTMNMDEYLGPDGGYIPTAHPLSFRGYLQQSLVNNLRADLRPDPGNLLWPNPHEPAQTTELMASFGGADICFGGMGLTGHFAFNDPPGPEEPNGAEEFCDSRTRCLTIGPVSQAQMCMGGTHGNWDIIPRRAVTLGMYELMMSKKMHLTFMRSWHAGVLRRALFGPISTDCPGSFIQQHPNVEVTLTQLAAELPVVNVTQSTGQDAAPGPQHHTELSDPRGWQTDHSVTERRREKNVPAT